MDRMVKWKSNRRFGIEYEYNRDTSCRQIAQVVTGAGLECNVRRYEHTSVNSAWVAKPDSSCGFELVTPILSGWRKLKVASEILIPLAEAGIEYGNECGNHVHVELADFSADQAKILACYWIKIEKFVMNGTPSHRQSNNYCNTIERRTLSLIPNHTYSLDNVWEYCSGRNAINFSNFRADRHGSCGTVEFRFGEMTRDPEVIKNRVRFLIWFVEICKILPSPDNLNWLSPKQVLSMFGLLQRPDSPIKLHFSPAIQSMKKWILKRVIDLSPNNYIKDRQICQRLLDDINNEQSLTEDE